MLKNSLIIILCILISISVYFNIKEYNKYSDLRKEWYQKNQVLIDSINNNNKILDTIVKMSNKDVIKLKNQLKDIKADSINIDEAKRILGL